MEQETKSPSSPEASDEARSISGKRRPTINRGERRGEVVGAAEQYRHLRDLTDGNARFFFGETSSPTRVPVLVSSCGRVSLSLDLIGRWTEALEYLMAWPGTGRRWSFESGSVRTV